MRVWIALLLVAACAPKVDPRTPFDEDDPRAGHREMHAAAEEPPPPVAPTPPAPQVVVREGTIERAALVAHLDAQPGPLLRCLEVDAELADGKFAGWRLVRFVKGCDVFAGLDLAVGDVLVSVNGRVLVKPADLGDLWAELYTAAEINAELRRNGAPLLLHFTVTGAPPAPTPPKPR